VTPHLLEYFASRSRAAMSDIVLALSDRFVHIGTGGDVEQSLTLFLCWLFVLLQIDSLCLP